VSVARIIVGFLQDEDRYIKFNLHQIKFKMKKNRETDQEKSVLNGLLAGQGESPLLFNGPDGPSVFDAWAQKQQNLGEFNADTVDTYRSVWSSWLQWLAAQTPAVAWQEASAPLIHLFLTGPAASLLTPRSAIRPDQMANFTQQRYWRVLRAVYAQAVTSGWLTHSPALALDEVHRPTIRQRSRISQVLPPGALAQLRRPDVLEVLFPDKVQTDKRAWLALRDRATLAVLAHSGITTTELLKVKGCDLRIAMSDGSSEALLARGAQHQIGNCPDIWLDVGRGEELFGRVVPLSSEAWKTLCPWLHERERVFARRLSAPSASDVIQVCLDGPLMVSQKTQKTSATAGEVGGVMDASNVYLLVKRALTRLFEQPDMAGEHPKARGLSMASGAAIIRNTILREWVQTLGLARTMELAGLRSADALRLNATQAEPTASRD
jgi:site-specific recombinase XerD